jgi:hypothetical protein
MANAAQPLFQESDQLIHDGNSVLATRHGIRNEPDEWNNRLTCELKTEVLDDLYDHLWLVAKKEGRHIDSLHEQLIKKRTITVAEHPRLHLVWYYDTVYLKPIPDYLLNHTIWSTYLCSAAAQQAQDQQRTYNRKAALGFLRSYGLLIQHESDFIIAKQANLVPKGVSFVKFQKFIKPFRELSDGDVSPRYHYGQFRLTRLNYAVRFFRPPSTKRTFPWNYQEQYWQTSQYLQRFGAPLAFAFAILSLILSSMQVVLAALGQNAWAAFVQVSWGFSVAVIIFAASPVFIAVLGVAWVLLVQGQFALRMKLRENHPNGGPQAHP